MGSVGSSVMTRLSRLAQHRVVRQIGSDQSPNTGPISPRRAVGQLVRSRSWLHVSVPEMALAEVAFASSVGGIEERARGLQRDAEGQMDKRARRLAQVAAEAGSPQRAVEILELAGRQFVLSPWSEVWLARWLSRTHRFPEAIAACERALNADPEFSAADTLRRNLVAATSFLNPELPTI